MWFSSYPLTSTSRWLDSASRGLDTAVQRLSTLRRINGAADDAAGLSISQRFLAQLNGESVAQRSAMDGMSLAETADGALGQVGSNLQRMRELALQARNGTLNDHDRASLDAEYQQLGQEVNRVIGGTRFNGQKILAGDAGDRQINTGPGSGDTMTLTTPDMRQDSDLAAATGGSVASGNTSGLIDSIDKALESLGGHRASLGATEHRLQQVADTADLRYESASRAYDRLTSADPAQTMSLLRSAQIQQYAAISMFRTEQSSMQRLLSLFG